MENSGYDWLRANWRPFDKPKAESRVLDSKPAQTHKKALDVWEERQLAKELECSDF